MDREFTSKETAQKLNVARRTINQWCKTGILFATLRKTDFGEEYWIIKESSLADFTPPKRGRKPKDFLKKEIHSL